jgi:prepilin-type N-terminal cleavage/methylation domain-containing protein
MRTFNRQFVRQQGFSLIEVMIAVVVLSTGLLALAALQANLTRSAADSKARSRVAALVSSRMDQLRAQGYASAASVGAVACVSNNDVCAAQGDAAISGLSITQTVTENVLAGSTDARYKVVRVAATWSDASGNQRALTMDSVLSPTALDASDTLVDKELAGDSGKAPIVRTTNPAVPGMIPIAVSTTDSTAATNPRPELLSQGNNSSITGTKFDVLTYTNESSNSARIQRRVETTVIGCTCQYGAGGNSLPEIYRQAQWPAVWTGARYEVYKPDNTATQPAGATLASGPASGVSQSPLCTECCRDHHDGASASVAKFDPERSAVTGETLVHTHYNRDNQDNLVIVANNGNGTYLEACRMIRVDGIWRTASDMYNRYAGLLATATAAGKTSPATTGIPTTAAADAYGGNRDAGVSGFVKDFLAANLTGLRSSSWTVNLAAATTLYDDAGLNAPAELSIRRPTKTTSDERYHHLRGLYVDYLNQAARDRIATALLPANCPSGNSLECALPFIPFTTVNLTELAFWKAQVVQGNNFQDNTSILKVESASALTFNATEPYRGRTNALTNANNTDTAYAIARVTASNSGVAVQPQGVDPLDDQVWTLDDPAVVTAEETRATDRQFFRIQATGENNGTSRFWTRLSGLPQTSDKITTNDPLVDWSVGTDAGSCGGTLSSKNDYDPNDYSCANVPALGLAGSVRISGYYITGTAAATLTASCSYGATTVSVTDTASRPFYRNFSVQSASVGGVPASLISVQDDGTLRELTTISFAAISVEATVLVNFTEGAQIPATIASCTANRRGNSYEFGTIVWNRSWE